MWKRKLFRDWQKEHQGKLPDLSVIPDNCDYCYTCTDEVDRVIDFEGIPYTLYKYKMCDYYYKIEIPEAERESHDGIVACGQTYIGGCHLLKKTDDDFKGWGLLWDGCKECSLKMHKDVSGEYDER